MRLPWTAPAALAVAVWMLYAADRLADAAAGDAFEERHRFHQRNGTAFAVCWLLCAPVLLWLVLHLPHALRDGWLLLAVPLAAYVGAVHALHLRHVPKEPLIAVFFSMAVAMPVVSSGTVPRGIPSAIACFALLCWLNCAAIAAWESPARSYVDPATRWIGRHFTSIAVLFTMLLVCFALVPRPARWMASALAAGVLLLLALHRQRGRMSRLHVRALADAALLSPLVVLPLLAWLSR